MPAKPMVSERIFSYKAKVYYGDTDASGVVYHGTYLNFFEAARIEMLNELGYTYSQMLSEGVGISPIHIDIKYKKPLHFEDAFEIQTHIQALTKATVTFVSKLYRTDDLCCEAIIKLAAINENEWKPCRLPVKFLALL